MKTEYFRVCGICPKCGAAMTGENAYAMQCVSCGYVESLHPDDVAFLREAMEQHKRRQKEGRDA